MLKLIIGVKGTGKTKTLISMVNEAAEASKGTVVCIEKGVGLRFDVKHTVRLVNTNEYLIFDAEALHGFVAGILASNHDVTDVFIDSALKISNNDVAAFDVFVKEIDELSNKLDVNVVMTSSIPTEEASDIVKKYI
jgi:ABC-type phosphate/phosphonate transport system ATPase subunit